LFLSGGVYGVLLCHGAFVYAMLSCATSGTFEIAGQPWALAYFWNTR
jgi:hypothetical protein